MPAFNRSAAPSRSVGGDDLTLQLRLYQAVNVVVLVGDRGAGRPRVRRARGRARALLPARHRRRHDQSAQRRAGWRWPSRSSPCATTRKQARRRLRARWRSAALAIKLSAALLLAFDGLRLALTPVARRLPAAPSSSPASRSPSLSVAALVVAARACADARRLHRAARRSDREPPALLALVRGAAARLPRSTSCTCRRCRGSSASSSAPPPRVWILWCAYRAARDRRHADAGRRRCCSSTTCSSTRSCRLVSAAALAAGDGAAELGMRAVAAHLHLCADELLRDVDAARLRLPAGRHRRQGARW